MPIRRCKCGHAYFMHAGATLGGTHGDCHGRDKDDKKERCPCKDYNHDPASGKF